MRFRVSKLIHAPVGTRQAESFEADSVWLDDEIKAERFAAAFVMTRMNDSVMVEGRADCQVKVQCVRSLELFDLAISVSLEDVFFALPGHRLTENPGEDDPLHRIGDDGYVDVTEVVREHVIMAIPINPISPAYQDDQVAQANADAILGDDASDWLTIRWADKA